MIGYGSIGKRHVQNLLSIPNIKIIVCTKQKVENPYPKKVKIVCSVLDCLKEKPDAGIIANVTNLHVKTAIKLANAGVDLFIEKPLSDSLIDIKNLLHIINKKNLVTQIGCQMRFHKCIKKIKKLISNNYMGKILSVKVECGSFLPDWHPDEDYSKSYAARRDLGGGVVLTCIHEIDYLYWMFGDVSAVFSITGKFSDLKISADDLSASVIKFKNNIVAELHLDYFQKPSFRSCKIIGTRGIVYWDSNRNIVKLYDNNKNKWIEILKWSNYDRNLMYVQEINHFLNCVKKQKSTINPIQVDGLATLRIGLAIIQSSKSKKMVKL